MNGTKTDRRLTIVFAALHAGYYRNIESAVDELAGRGHLLFLGSERHASALGGEQIVERLAAGRPKVSVGEVPRREKDSYFLGSKIRLALDYLRYLEPAYAATDALRQRAVIRTPSGLVSLLRHWPFSGARGRRALQWVLDRVDHALEPSPAIERFLDEQHPDVVLVTPLVGLVASSQLDLLRAAQARRIPTGVLVWSWDHLSSKAIIRDWPDRLFVWNDTQRQEAELMHGIPTARIVVTGAQSYDRWFDRQPSRDRESFANAVGLPDAGPYLLWVCSALFPGSPSEAEFVMRWLSHLRHHGDAAVRNVAVLIRPHPSRMKEWEGVDWARFGRTAFWGGNPVDVESRNDYFDSLHHSSAVVGLNTSAFIEAGVVGRPVMAILPEEFRSNQEGTLHFKYLQTVGGGLLTTARTLDEHVAQVTTMLAGPPTQVLERQRRFVESFVRPHGLHVAATKVLSDAIETLATAPGTRASARVSLIGRFGLWVLRAIERHPSGRRFILDAREKQAKIRRASDEHRAVSWT